MCFPFAALGGKRVPDFGLKLGCVFQRLLYRKLCPGIEPQGGTCFPVRSSSGDCVPDSSLGMGRAFRMGFKRKLCPRIDMASSGKRVSECRAGVFGGRGWKGEHCLHTRRRRGGDPHGGTWGVVVLRVCRGCAVLPLPKIHLVNPAPADRMRSTAAQVEWSWAAPLLRSRGQCLNGSDLLCFECCLSASESSINAVKSKTKATKSSASSDGPGMTADSSHRA